MRASHAECVRAGRSNIAMPAVGGVGVWHGSLQHDFIATLPLESVGVWHGPLQHDLIAMLAVRAWHGPLQHDMIAQC